MGKRKDRSNGHFVGNGRDLYHRHFCPKGHRVFPYDSMEALTIAPKPGVKGPILLYSYNSRLRETKGITRTAYCWVCKEWVETTRLNRFDIEVLYIRRAGVQVRFPDGRIESQPSEKSFVKALENRIEERRGIQIVRR